MSDESKVFARLREKTESLRNARTGATLVSRKQAASGALEKPVGQPGPRAPSSNGVVIAAKHTGLGGEVPAASTQADAKALLQFELDPSAQLLQPIAEFLSSYAKARYHPRTAERVALASQELVDNAMSFGSVSSDVQFVLLESRRTIEICVTNDSSPGRVSALQAQIERLQGGSEQVYQQEMAKSMSGAGGRVSLGLARVSHEAKMDLVFELLGMRVTMRARCNR